MAVMNLESMKLRCPTVAERVVAGMVRKGSVKVNGRTPAYLSYSRHPFTHSVRLDREPTARINPVDTIDAGNPALRAGRPASPAGVLVSCCAAPCGSRSTSWWSQPQQAKRRQLPAGLAPAASMRGTMLGTDRGHSAGR